VPSKRRKKILCAAERLLKHYGFGKTTVADIAREAGVGVGTVYLEFPSKEAIVAELSTVRHGTVLEAMRAAAGGRGSHAHRLSRMLEARVERLLKVAREGQHGFDLVRCVCPAVGEVHQEFREQEVALLSDFLSAAQKAGEFSLRNPAVTARVLIRICDTFAPRPDDRRPDLKQIQQELEVLCRLLLDGLVAR
jgi:AcrR family transcriptional regulator